MTHKVHYCQCPDCFRTRQHWAYKRWETRRNRGKNTPKIEPPADVERRESSQAKDEVITSATILPKRYELKGFMDNY